MRFAIIIDLLLLHLFVKFAIISLYRCFCCELSDFEGSTATEDDVNGDKESITSDTVVIRSGSVRKQREEIEAWNKKNQAKRAADIELENRDKDVKVNTVPADQNDDAENSLLEHSKSLKQMFIDGFREIGKKLPFSPKSDKETGKPNDITEPKSQKTSRSQWFCTDDQANDSMLNVELNNCSADKTNSASVKNLVERFENVTDETASSVTESNCSTHVKGLQDCDNREIELQLTGNEKIKLRDKRKVDLSPRKAMSLNEADYKRGRPRVQVHSTIAYSKQQTEEELLVAKQEQEVTKESVSSAELVADSTATAQNKQTVTQLTKSGQFYNPPAVMSAEPDPRITPRKVRAKLGKTHPLTRLNSYGGPTYSTM